MKKLRLFHIADGQVERQPASLFRYERELQDLLEKHLHDFLGVTFLAREYAATRGVIDTLGIDDVGRPVIVEYKRNEHDKVINQGLRYLRWLLRNELNFFRLVEEKLGNKKTRQICWSPRLLILAGNFSDYQWNAAQIVPNIELLRYRRFGEQGLLLDWIHQSEWELGAQASKSTLPATRPKTDTSTLSALPTLGKFKYRGSMGDEEWALTREVLAYVQSLGPYRLDGLKTYLAFRRSHEVDGRRRWRDFASVRPNIQSGIRIDVLERTQRRSPEEGFTTTDKFHRCIHIRSRSDFRKAKPLLRDAYENS